MIKTVFFDGININLTKSNSEDNVFSIVIGKNGTGKSRLLQLICSDLIDDNNKNALILDRKPSKIIAISTTPFDKFPIKTVHNKNYYYQGIKNIKSLDVSKGYISKFIGDFFHGLIEKKSNSLSKTLNYLGYKDEISIRFKYIGGSVIKRIIEQKSIREHSSLFIQSTLTQKKISEKEIIRYKTRELEYYLKNRYYDGEEQVNLNYITDDSKMKDLLESVTNSPWLHSSRVLNVKLKGTSTSFDKNLVLSIDLVNLIHSGLLKIDKISLKKISSKEPFDIEHASSGEQSIIMNILGISSLIKDNSLILIDEPEVCLHPEWQEKYIQLIIDVFKNQRKCHFIIATHSPQIIANLSEKNCFITSIENGICKNSKEYINQSADYQLATLFNAPGFKNEYLSRVSLSLLSKIMANKSIDNDDLNVMKTLLSVKENLSKDDPILSLIISLEEMVNYYA